MTNKLEDLFSSLNNKFQEFNSRVLKVRAGGPIASCITLDVGSDPQRLFADVFDFFEKNFPHLIFWPFRNTGSKIMKIKLKVKEIDSKFKQLFSARFFSAKYSNSMIKNENFSLKVANIEDDFFYDRSTLAEIGKILDSENFISWKSLDYNGVFNNQALLTFKKVPVTAFASQNGFFNLYDDEGVALFRRPLKILWNTELECSHCKLCGHTVDFCPWTDMQDEELVDLAFQLKKLNKFLDPEYVAQLKEKRKKKFGDTRKEKKRLRTSSWRPWHKEDKKEEILVVKQDVLQTEDIQSEKSEQIIEQTKQDNSVQSEHKMDIPVDLDNEKDGSVVLDKKSTRSVKKVETKKNTKKSPPRDKRHKDTPTTPSSTNKKLGSNRPSTRNG
jgi:hypothetical protein